MKGLFSSLFPIILLCFSFSGNPVFGQRDSTKMNKDVEVIKPYRPSISTANKINQLPVIEDTIRFTPEFNYSVKDIPLTSGFKSVPPSVQELKTPGSEDHGPGYLKVGVGMYNTTYGDFHLNDNKLKDRAVGLKLYHLASQSTAKLRKGDVVDAPFSKNLAEIFGNAILGSSTLSGSLSYKRDGFRYYGYPDTIPAGFTAQPLSPFYRVRQFFQKTKFQVGVQSNENTSNLNYKTELWYHYFNTRTDQQENAVGLNANFDYQFEKFKGFLETTYEHYATDGIILNGKRKTGWLKVSPFVQFTSGKLTFSGGLGLFYASENLGDSKIKIYPRINASFTPVSDQLIIYAGINGYLENSNYSAICYENNFVNPVHDLLKPDHQVILTGGLKGKINRVLSYNIEAKYETVNNMHFFVTNAANLQGNVIYNNVFDIIFDNMKITNFSAELSYSQEKYYDFVLKAHLYNYAPFRLAFAPHLQKFDIEASSKFRITDKLSGFSDLNILGKREALIIMNPSDLNGPRIALKPVVLLNVGADYQLKDNLKLFARIDNLLNQRYEQWLGYSSQGVRLMAGISLSF